MDSTLHGIELLKGCTVSQTKLRLHYYESKRTVKRC